MNSQSCCAARLSPSQQSLPVTERLRGAANSTAALENAGDILSLAPREAVALAWSTDYPQLVLPCLMQELEEGARRYLAKRSQIRERASVPVNITFPVNSRWLAA